MESDNLKKVLKRIEKKKINILFEMERIEKRLRKLRLIWLCSLIIGGLTVLNGCDVCGNSSNVVVEEGDYYFSALPANSTSIEPSIFRINSDGTNLREVIKNAELYSPPSRDKKLVFLAQYGLGARSLMMSNIDGSNAIQIGPDFWTSRQYPVLSPDGLKIAVYTGSGSLWLILNKIDFQKVSSQFCEGTLASFSPDASKLAIFEGKDLLGPLTLKIFDVTKSPPPLLSQKVYVSGIYKRNGIPSIEWSLNGELMTFVLSISVGPTYFDSIHVVQWYNLDNDNAIEMSGGAFMPALSPDNSKIAFAGGDGNIWVRSTDPNDRKNINLTTGTNQFINLYPRWTSDGNDVYYSKYSKDDITNIFHATLEFVSTATDPPQIRVLGNNIYRAFRNYR